MTLEFSPTIGGSLYLISDEGDDHAPMLRLEVVNEFRSRIPSEKREAIAAHVLKIAADLCVRELEEASNEG